MRPRLERRVVAIASVIVACGPGAELAGSGRPPSFEPENQTKASVVRTGLRPLIVDWPGPDIALLEGQSKAGLVVVRYVPDTRQMELLASCQASGRYEYVATTRQDEQLTLHDRAELQAVLPIGAARLEGDLVRAGQLAVQTTVVGLYRADRAVARPDLRGDDCGRATHVVNGIAVGAFQLVAGADTRGGAGASVAILGIGGRATGESTRESNSRGGVQAACAQAAESDARPPSGCGSPLRLELGSLADERPTLDGCARPAVWNGLACVRPSAAPGVSSDSPPTRQPPGPLAMVRIAAGGFVMGDDAGDTFARPAHAVTVGAFEIDVTEVTARDYEACVMARRCVPPNGALSPHCNWGHADRAEHPINCIRWEQAQAYCEFVGKRLPTEDEWEYAARGPEGRPYPWGTAAPAQQLCWGRGAMAAGTCEVASHPASKSPFGLLDMAGNVWEWTSSQACLYDGTRCQDAHVYRGGSWFSADPAELRASARAYVGPLPRDDIGVRCARDAI